MMFYSKSMLNSFNNRADYSYKYIKVLVLLRSLQYLLVAQTTQLHYYNITFEINY